MKTTILLAAMTMMTSSIVAFPQEPALTGSCAVPEDVAESFFPESIDSGLKSVLLPVDYGRMVNCREWVSDALATVTPDSYGYDEKKRGREAVE